MKIPDIIMPPITGTGEVYKTTVSGKLDSSRVWNAWRDKGKPDALWINIENGENDFFIYMHIFYKKDYQSKACKYVIVQIDDAEKIRSYKLSETPDTSDGNEHEQELGPEDYNESLKEDTEQVMKQFEDEELEIEDR